MKLLDKLWRFSQQAQHREIELAIFFTAATTYYNN